MCGVNLTANFCPSATHETGKGENRGGDALGNIGKTNFYNPN